MPDSEKLKKQKIAATKKYEDAAYFKTLVRFPADVQEEIRRAAELSGRSLNNFIVASVCRSAGIPEPEILPAGNKPKNDTTTPRRKHTP